MNWRIGLLLALSAGLVPSALAAPKVVASIKPIHSLASGVMQGVAEPTLLLEGAGTPHGYSLKPSQMRALSRADLVVWVGPALEGFLMRPLQNVAGKARVLELLEAPGMTLLPSREGGTWEGHHHEEGHVEADHQEGEIDPHLWLSPENAAAIVLVLTDELSEIDPDNAERYQANSASMLQRIAVLQEKIRQELAPVKTVSYLVFHDAYQYFEKAFSLAAVGSVAVDPERKPGARRLREVRSKIAEMQARALFAEPQFEPRLIQTVAEGTGVRIGTLDPLGADIPAGPDAWFALMNQLSDQLLYNLTGR